MIVHESTSSISSVTPQRGHLRRTLGLLKWHATEVLPARFRQALMPRLRRRWANRLVSLPSLAESSDGLDMEIHMLCGEATADMGVWASWSIMRFVPGAALYVHSDGTLQDETFTKWKRIVPQCRLVPKTTADALVAAGFEQKYPLLSTWRTHTVVAPQNIDYFLFGEREYVLGMDSDVLCFRSPELIIQSVRQRLTEALFMRDRMYAYSMPETTFLQRYGALAPTRVNGGFWLSRRLSDADFAFMERELASWDGDWRDAYWAPQTLLGAAFSRRSGGYLPAHEYVLALGGHTRDAVVRHYLGTRFFRPRFFTEGIPAVIRG